MFNLFSMFNMLPEINDVYLNTNKDLICLDYKRGGDFNQAHSLKDFISKLKGSQEAPEEPIDIGNKKVYVVFGAVTIFQLIMRLNICGLRSIYFNGVKEKRKKGIRFSLTTAGKTLSGKIHSWMKNKHSYAIFNCGIVQINQPARFIDNDMLNLEYIEILSHPFDETILSTNHNLITNNIDFQLIKDTIETAIKICTDNIINDDETDNTINDDEVEQASITEAAAEQASITGAAAEFEGGANLTEDQNNRDHIEFENLLKLKSERNAIIQISKRIYGDIMRLFKFNKDSYLKHIDLNDDIDIFSLSKSQLIVEKMEVNGMVKIQMQKIF